MQTQIANVATREAILRISVKMRQEGPDPPSVSFLITICAAGEGGGMGETMR